MKKSYRVYIGSHKYYTKGKDSAEAKRNAAHSHRNGGYDRNKSIAQIMKIAEAESY